MNLAPTIPHMTKAASVPRPSHGPKSLVRGVSWLALGNMVNAASIWGRIVLLAHIGNAEMIGQLALAWAICNPIDTLADLGLGGVLITDARREYRFRDYLAVRLTTSALAMVAISALAAGGGYDPAMRAVMLLAGAVVVAESIGDIFHALLQRLERMDLAAKALMIRGPLGLAGLAGGVLLSGNLEGGLWGMVFAALATLVAWDIPVTVWAARGDRIFNNGAAPIVYGRLMRLAWLSLPLGAASASMALMAAAPRYAVSHYCGPKVLGGFAVAGGLMVAASLAIGSVSEAAVPRLANYFAAGRPEFVRILGRMVALVAGSGVVLVVAMAIFGRAIITLLYGAEFAEYSHLATGLMAAAVLKDLTVALGRGLSAMRRFRTVMTLRICTIFLLILALLLLVPRFGTAGAVFAMILAGMCGAAASGGVAWRAIRPLRTAFPELPPDRVPKNR